jgi:hypothetical protein
LRRFPRDGVLLKLDKEAKAPYVEPAVWNKLTFDEKKNVASTLCGILGSRWIDIDDGYSGKPLATFTKGGGYRIAD